MKTSELIRHPIWTMSGSLSNIRTEIENIGRSVSQCKIHYETLPDGTKRILGSHEDIFIHAIYTIKKKAKLTYRDTKCYLANIILNQETQFTCPSCHATVVPTQEICILCGTPLWDDNHDKFLVRASGHIINFTRLEIEKSFNRIMEAADAEIDGEEVPYVDEFTSTCALIKAEQLVANNNRGMQLGAVRYAMRQVGASTSELSKKSGMTRGRAEGLYAITKMGESECQRFINNNISLTAARLIDKQEPNMRSAIVEYIRDRMHLTIDTGYVEMLINICTHAIRDAQPPDRAVHARNMIILKNAAMREYKESNPYYFYIRAIEGSLDRIDDRPQKWPGCLKCGSCAIRGNLENVCIIGDMIYPCQVGEDVEGCVLHSPEGYVVADDKVDRSLNATKFPFSSLRNITVPNNTVYNTYFKKIEDARRRYEDITTPENSAAFYMEHHDAIRANLTMTAMMLQAGTRIYGVALNIATKCRDCEFSSYVNGKIACTKAISAIKMKALYLNDNPLQCQTFVPRKTLDISNIEYTQMPSASILDMLLGRVLDMIEIEDYQHLDPFAPILGLNGLENNIQNIRNHFDELNRYEKALILQHLSSARSLIYDPEYNGNRVYL